MKTAIIMLRDILGWVAFIAVLGAVIWMGKTVPEALVLSFIAVFGVVGVVAWVISAKERAERQVHLEEHERKKNRKDTEV